MKIIQYGTLTFIEGEGPKIEGWTVEREPADPVDATLEQLLLGFVIHWGQEKFKKALSSATLDVFRKMAAEAEAKKKKPLTDA